MKRLLTFLPVLLAVAACGPKAPAAPAEASTEAPSSASSATAAETIQPAVVELPGLTLVRAFYQPSIAPFPENPASDTFFFADLARALKAQSKPGEVGPIDFDYRYGAQDVQITNLQINAANTADGERAVAKFDNIGKPYEVDYDLMLTRQGWRIANISAPAQNGDQAWNLRATLKLGPAELDSRPLDLGAYTGPRGHRGGRHAAHAVHHGHAHAKRKHH